MFSSKALSLAAMVLAAFSHTASSQTVQTPVVTTFDQDLEGWTLTPGQNATIGHEVNGGAPGGYVRLTAGGLGRSDIEAPAAYLGDWSHLDGQGVFQFDHKIFSLGALPLGPPYKPFEVVLHGGGNVARFLSVETAQLSWTTATVPLQEQAWVVESGTWTSLLTDIERVQIRIELVGNDQLPDDEDGIDNIMLLGDTTATAIGDGVAPRLLHSELRSAYPNPFNPTVNLVFDLATSGDVQVVIYNAAGRLVRRLIDEELPSSTYRAAWDARDDSGVAVPSGVYFAKLIARDGASTKKIVLLK